MPLRGAATRLLGARRRHDRKDECERQDDGTANRHFHGSNRSSRMQAPDQLTSNLDADQTSRHLPGVVFDDNIPIWTS